jgi:hypothetical protein
MDGLASCEALFGRVIGGVEENHEKLQLIKAAFETKYETRPIQIRRAASAWLRQLAGGYGQQDSGSDVTGCSCRRSQLIAIRFKRHIARDTDCCNV